MCNLTEFYRVKDQLEILPRGNAVPGSKARTFPANEWKLSQVLEIRINFPNEVAIRRIRTSVLRDTDRC